MRKRNVVIRNKTCSWKPQTKRKTEIKYKMSTAGFVNPVAAVVVLAVFAAFFYMYSINQSAVKGLQFRKIEKEISQIKKENESLRIKEAELKSLYKIEQFSKDLNMLEASEVTFLDETNPLAMNSSVNGTVR